MGEGKGGGGQDKDLLKQMGVFQQAARIQNTLWVG